MLWLIALLPANACLACTLEDLCKPTGNWNSAELLDGDIIKVGDLAACLVRFGETICLAVLKISSFEYEHSKHQVTSMSMDDFEELDNSNQSKVTVLAQIMDLEMASETQWNWTRHYVRFDLGKKCSTKDSEVSSCWNFILRIPARLVSLYTCLNHPSSQIHLSPLSHLRNQTHWLGCSHIPNWLTALTRHGPNWIQMAMTLSVMTTFCLQSQCQPYLTSNVMVSSV